MGQQPTAFKVIDMRRHPSANPKRLGKWDRLVIYELDEFHRYSLVIADEEFSEDVLKSAVRKDIQERQPWLGKQFQL